MDEDIVDLKLGNYFVRTESEGYVSGGASDRFVKNCDMSNRHEDEGTQE